MLYSAVHCSVHNLLFVIQVLQNGGGETSFMEYDSSAPGEGFAASFHDMSTMETKGTWGRCWWA